MTENINPQQSSTSFIIGLVGIFATILISLFGWMPMYMVVGILIIACLLYESSTLFATGIVGMVAVSCFSAMTMFPMNIYWSIVIIISLLLSVKVVFYLVKVQS